MPITRSLITVSSLVLTGVVLTGCGSAAPVSLSSSSSAAAGVGDDSVDLSQVCAPFATVGKNADPAATADQFGFTPPAGADCFFTYESTTPGHVGYSAVYHGDGVIAAWRDAATAGGWQPTADSNDLGLQVRKGDDIINVITTDVGPMGIDVDVPVVLVNGDFTP